MKRQVVTVEKLQEVLNRITPAFGKDSVEKRVGNLHEALMAKGVTEENRQAIVDLLQDKKLGKKLQVSDLTNKGSLVSFIKQEYGSCDNPVQAFLNDFQPYLKKDHPLKFYRSLESKPVFEVFVCGDNFQIYSGSLESVQRMALAFNNLGIKASAEPNSDQKTGRLVLEEVDLELLETKLSQLQELVKSGFQIGLAKPKGGAAAQPQQKARGLSS